MVNLTIRLSKSGANSGSKPEQNLLEADETSLAPDFVDANLPVAKGIGFLFPETCRINFVGAKVQPKPGGKVHICLMCNFPIAVYGRLDPCQHVLCFACARSDSTCFVCKEKVVRIQKVDVLVGIFICGVPGCLRSFLVQPDFELHVANDHSQHQPESAKGVSLGKPNPSQIPTTVPRKDDSQQNNDERLQRRRNGWEPSKQGQKVRENGNDEAGQNQRDRGSETGPSRKRERERGGHLHKSFQPSSKHGQQTGSQLQQTVTLPPPPPGYHLPNYPAQAAFPPLNDQNGAAYPHHHRDQFYSGMVMPPRPDATVALQPGLVGLQQQGDQWPRSFVTVQEGFGTNGGYSHMRPIQLQPDGLFPQGCGGHPRPQFIFPDQFGLPMSTGHVPSLMSMPRFHEGHLPPPPPGPPPQKTMFNSLQHPASTGPPCLGLQVGPEQLIVDYGWRPGNGPSNQFGGPRGGH